MHHAIRPTERAALGPAVDLGSADAAYRGRMLTRARRIVVDPDLAEAVVQEAFLRAWRARGSFDADGPPLVNWLLVITANTAVDMVKAPVRAPAADRNCPAGSRRRGRH